MTAAPEAETFRALHADTLRVLTAWSSPDEDSAAMRARMLALLDSGPRVMSRDGGPEHVTASMLVLDSTLQRVLLCLHGRFHRWVQMGGHCEPGDATIAATALREAAEESGIGGLRLAAAPIGIDIHPLTCRSGPSRHYDVRYAAVAPPDAVPVPSHESEDLRWFPLDALPTPLAHATAPLIAPALAALTRTLARPAS